MKTLLLASLLAMTSTACVTYEPESAALADEDDGTAGDAARVAASSEFHVVDVTLRYQALRNEAFRVFSTRRSFVDAYGIRGDFDVDFRTHWVFVYQAGTQPTGGYIASILDITRRNDRIRFQTQLVTPGPDCFTTQAETRPYVVVAFRKPTRPNAATFSVAHDELEDSCEEPAPVTCELVDCLPHLVCDDSSGHAECVPPAEPASCAATLCLTNTYCDESTGTAQCLPLVCPRPGTTINCKLPLTPDRAPACNPSFQSWVGSNCPNVTFAL